MSDVPPPLPVIGQPNWGPVILDCLTYIYGRLDELASMSGRAMFAEFSFNNTTTTPPAGGQVRLNNADQTLATALWVHDQDATGQDFSLLWEFMTPAGAGILIQDKDNSAQRQYYRVTATPVDQGTHFEVPVTWDRGGAVLSAQRVLVWVGPYEPAA